MYAILAAFNMFRYTSLDDVKSLIFIFNVCIKSRMNLNIGPLLGEGDDNRTKSNRFF